MNIPDKPATKPSISINNTVITSDDHICTVTDYYQDPPGAVEEQGPRLLVLRRCADNVRLFRPESDVAIYDGCRVPPPRTRRR